MAHIFCQSKAYRDLTVWHFAGLTEEQAVADWIKWRWGGSDEIRCPHCQFREKHYFIQTRKRWRCGDCEKTFGIYTGTVFEHSKLSCKVLLSLIFEFVAAPKGLASNQLHSKIGITYRAAFLNLHKIREALWEVRDRGFLSGVVHIDGGHFGGKPRRPQFRKKTTATQINSKLRNRKLGIIPPNAAGPLEPWNKKKLKNRRVVLVMRQVSPVGGIGGIRTRVAIVKAETAVAVEPLIKKNITPNTKVMTDQSSAYSRLSRNFSHSTVNHSEMYSAPDGTNNNHAESFFARMRRSEFGVHHGMRPQYMVLYANEFAWREDHRHCSLREKFEAVMRAIFKAGSSKVWRGYQQGNRLEGELGLE